MSPMENIPQRLRSLAESLREFESPRQYSLAEPYCRRPVFGIRHGVEIGFHEHCQRENERLKRHIALQLTQAGLLFAELIEAGLLRDSFDFIKIQDACRWFQRKRHETGNVVWLGEFCMRAVSRLSDLQRDGVFDGCFPIRSSVPIPPTQQLEAYRSWVCDSLEALASFVEQRASPDHQQPQTEELTPCS